MLLIEEAVIELERELQVRKHVYPRLILVGKLTATEAERRVTAMECAVRTLRKLAADDKVLPTPTERAQWRVHQ